MRTLFLPSADLSRPLLTIDGADAHHLLHVLRIRTGDFLTILDNRGGAVRGEVAEPRKRDVDVRLIGPAICPPDPPIHITVAQALGKGDKFEQVLQHATEVGACAFIPLLTERTIVRIDSRDGELKRARWSLIVKGAAEQAGRGRIPDVESLSTFGDLCARFGEFARVMLLHPDGGSVHPISISVGCRVLLLVGPEGGFSPTEVGAAESCGAVRTSLGPYILRTETAALVAVTRILYEAGRR